MSKTYKIAVIGGDGMGPEVAREGVKVLRAVAPLEGFSLEFTDFDWGGDRYLATGEILPPSAVEDMNMFDAIYLGAIGHPDVKPGILEKGILLSLRFALDQYINLRPVKLYPGVSKHRSETKVLTKLILLWFVKTLKDCTPDPEGF